MPPATKLQTEASQDQINLVETSWQLLRAQRQELVDTFYAHLFKLNPEVRKLFHAAPSEQSAKLMSTLNTIINGMAVGDLLDHELAKLGEQHRQWGVKDEDFDTAWQALLLALSDLLGPKLTDELREAWRMLYYTIADKMRYPAVSADESHPPPSAQCDT